MLIIKGTIFQMFSLSTYFRLMGDIRVFLPYSSSISQLECYSAHLANYSGLHTANLEILW